MNSSQPPHSAPRADFLPTASLAMLAFRAEVLADLRRFFDAAGYLEVDTPILSSDIVVDAYLEPFVTHAGSSTEPSSPADERFLQTSPEFAMKRLLAAGAQAIYQVTHAFRRGEFGRLHNPEFTMVEWYRVGDTHHDQMIFVENLVMTLFENAASTAEPTDPVPEGVPGAEWVARREPPPSSQPGGHPDPATRAHAGQTPVAREVFNPKFRWRRPFQRITYDEAFEWFAGSRVLSLTNAQLADLARSHNLTPPPGLRPSDRDGWLNFLLAEIVEPNLGARRPMFVYDYPVGQAALARVRHDTPPVAERFELYIDGMEICNGYHELTDPRELRDRMRRQASLRAKEGARPLPDHNRLLDAMAAGLPPCAGVALGFDRLLMALTGVESVQDVIAFPFDRA